MTSRNPEHNDVDFMFDRFEDNNVPIWDVIHMFQNGINIHELERILNNRPHLLINVLYIMRELTSDVVLPIWRIAAEHLSSDHWETAYYSLNIIESVLPHINSGEVLRLLDRIQVDGDLIEERTAAILAALDTGRNR